LALALAPAAAFAAHHKKPSAAVQQVWSDCTHHNSLQGHYSPAVLEQAFAELPTSDKEYSLCANEIRNAEQQAVGGSVHLPTVSTSKRRKVAKNATSSLKQAKKRGASPVVIGGHRIAAGAVTLPGSSFLSDLPTPILIVLVVLIALGSVPLALRVQSLVRARRPR
jgi:hypothetical protein